MRIYTAHLHPSRQPKLLLEGWSWGAFLFGPLWLLLEGAWIAALLDLAAFILTFSLVPMQFWGPCPSRPRPPRWSPRPRPRPLVLDPSWLCPRPRRGRR